jgi:hypothetical protein
MARASLSVRSSRCRKGDDESAGGFEVIVIPRYIAKITKLIAATVAVAALVTLASPASAMTFEAVTSPHVCGDQPCILATGLIDKDSVRQFDAFVREHQLAAGATVALNSEGGVLIYGLELGDHIRKAGLSTTVPGSEFNAAQAGECASACVFTFLGGVQRSVGDGARIGVHQIYANIQARDSLSVADAQWLSSLVAQEIERMGGGIGILVLTLRTPPEHIHWFSSAELDGLKVVTSIRYAALN